MQTWTFGKLEEYPSGPWDGEPDKAQWVDEVTDLDCLIVRNHFGALCGYVGVSAGHSLYEKPYHVVDDRVDVHGGLSYAAPCQEGGEICHVPAPGRPADVWWFGFDCAHYSDGVPDPQSLLFNGVYRDMGYVQAEVTSLAAQIADLG